MLEGEGLSIPALTKKCMADEEMRKNGKSVSDFVKKVVTDHMRSDSAKVFAIANLDEKELLTKSGEFLESEFGVSVKIQSAEDEDLYDPQNKIKVAVPGRPAIYLE